VECTFIKKIMGFANMACHIREKKKMDDQKWKLECTGILTINK